MRVHYFTVPFSPPMEIKLPFYFKRQSTPFCRRPDYLLSADNKRKPLKVLPCTFLAKHVILILYMSEN
jgi:hypothetical protein